MDISTRATLIGIVAILLWALLALFTATAGAIPPFELMALTFGVAFLGGMVVLAVRGADGLSELRQAPAPWLVAFLGLFGYHALYFYALQNAPVGEASIICYLWPLFIVLFAALLPGEGLKARHLGGALLGFAGTALIIFSKNGDAAPAGSVTGYAAAFGCALVWSSYSVVNRRFGQVPSGMLVGVCGAVALAGLASHLLFEDSVMPTATQWTAILALGLGPVGLAFLAWDHATKHGNITLLGTLSYLSPLVSTALLVLTGKAPASLTLGLAALLVIGGAVLATGLPGKRA
ncbi:aromatic amino acid exporter YddG [Gellertiella hungarica]|uniref:Drug/metabolite transporter (DMT)-like permease n=1 Tax=Gellertiella hungarica TaxID=1572859 RepID=A0A7W6NLB1_9HYPH|nr:EamA family transporter [Gellertiella hungarica]MBB4066365.1 drug/metabolite transporter (DMT)-like permease [Gellertiella hungarica]